MRDEWRRVAHYLGVHRARVHAIMRNVMVGEKQDKDAKYEMLLTWLKSAPKSADKIAILSSALQLSDRLDLAESVRKRGHHGDGDSSRVQSNIRSANGSRRNIRSGGASRSAQTTAVH
ncbi:hypothetical protein EGW08_009409 [Elysia chlorotica]|uniref:Death domain-containing protein n=1 Tax=Elysia chlorotica TaxID=188477 RepID=A0A3S0ZN13_ELYCH|nr:hypothetical protein EGW08_009409 [Elysia chlorotica]